MSLLALAGLGFAASHAQAQQADFPPVQQVAAAYAPQPSGPSPIEELQRRLDEQAQEIQQLQTQLNGGAPAMTGLQVAQTINGPIQATPVAAATATRPDGGKVVGSDMTVKVDYRNGGSFLYFATPDNAFTMHLGGWVQWDNVWWDQSQALKAPQGARSGPAQGVASGASQAGIGDLEDGEFFRRVRLVMEGTFWEQGVYRLNFAFENDQLDTTGLDEFWFGGQNLPVAQEVRLGHVKCPMGLEGDMSSSSRCMTFMERSSYSEAIELNQNFVTGVWDGGNYDEWITWQAALFRTDIKQATGAFFGDGQFGYQGRLTALPFYCDEGRELLHLGLSGGYRTGSASNGANVMELSARPELRDDDPAGAGLPAGSNDSRMIDTGAIAANQEYLVGTEMLWIAGPFSVQGEFGWNFLDGAHGVAPTSPTSFHPAITPTQDYTFSGGYIQAAYTLTGENRAYDRKYGTLDRYYYGKSGPYTNFIFTRDQDGSICFGPGAWEVAARYSHTDLNDGPAGSSTRIQGGIMDGFSVALNWYANNNFDMMFDWVFDNRYDVPAGVVPGWTSGFGVEAQFTF
jgi:phosphate-selective porin OprO/OprP